MNPIPKERLEDFDLYNRFSRSVDEINQHEAWLKKNPQYEMFRKSRIDDYFLTSREKEVINYYRGGASLDITKANALPFLRLIKIFDLVLKNHPMKTAQSSYLLRKQILQLSSPEMTSCQAYTLSVDPKQMGDLDYLCQPENWVAEEVGHQAKAIAALFTKMVGLSRENQTPVFYAIRGNTGSGKSTYLERLFQTNSGFLSLDPLKAFLKKNVKLTNVQVYEEANALFANFLNGIFKQKALRFIFDSRLLSVDYIQKYVIEQAEVRGEEVRLIEMDVPLETSLKRTLMRDPYGDDSCVPTDSVVWGFKQIRKERAALITLAKENPRITSYKLFNEQELVAEKKPDGFHIYNEEKYQECLRIPTDSEIEECLNKPWEGKTLKEALDAHAYQIKARVSAIPPDKAQFEVPSDDILLAKYEDFYKRMAIKTIFAEVGKGTISPDGKTIYVENVGNYYPSRNLFVATPVVLRDEETHQIISISSRVDFTEPSIDDLLEYAKEHENPVRFLLDHYRFWSYHEEKIIDFLGNYTSYYGVMDLFEISKRPYTVFSALGKALKKPSLKARATEFLFKQGALSILAPYLHEEEIHKRFEEIVLTSPDYYQRFAALKYLENTQPALDALEEEICRQIVTPLVETKEYRYLEQVLWLMPEHGYNALRGKCLSDVSILKFIGIKTPDRKEFDQIVEAHKELADQLNYYNLNFCLELPKDQPRSDFKGSGEEEYTRWWKSYNALLEKAILNRDLSEETRITALRKCALSLFITTYISQSEHDLRAKAKSSLSALLADPATPKKLKLEAARIKEWSNNIDFN